MRVLTVSSAHMGNFYTNFVIANTEATKVFEAIRELRRRAFIIADRHGHAVVFDERCDNQDVAEIESLGAALSERFQKVVVAAMNHDDDHLLLWLFHRGHVARYAGVADAFSFAWKLSRVSGGIVVFPLLVGALGWPIVIFQVLRHQMVVSLAGMPKSTIGFGYGYISRGEFPRGYSEGNVLRT